jgi:hypothetical protein
MNSKEEDIIIPKPFDSVWDVEYCIQFLALKKGYHQQLLIEVDAKHPTLFISYTLFQCVKIFKLSIVYDNMYSASIL